MPSKVNCSTFTVISALSDGKNSITGQWTKFTGGSFLKMDRSKLNWSKDLHWCSSKWKLNRHWNQRFFSVAKFPKQLMKITNVKTTDGKEPTRITANLTIKGITSPVTFRPATTRPMVRQNGDHCRKSNLTGTKYDIKGSALALISKLLTRLNYEKWSWCLKKLGAELLELSNCKIRKAEI